MKKFNTYLSATLFLLSFNIIAHTKNKRPFDKIKEIGVDRPSNHTGYGYLNAGSEAEAQDKVNFVCPKKRHISQLSYQQCVNNPGKILSSSSNLESTFHALNEKLFDQRLRDKTYEFIALQKAADSSKRPLKINRPQCISDNGIESKMPTLFKDPSERLTQVRKIIKRNVPSETKDLAAKLNAIMENRSAKKMSQGLLLNDQYRKSMSKFGCSNRKEDWQVQICNSLDDSHDKLKLSFPALFRSPEILGDISSRMAFFNDSLLERLNEKSAFDDESEKAENFRIHLLRVIGSYGSNSSDVDENIERGVKIYSEGIANDYGIGWDENSLDVIFNNAYDKGGINEYNPDTGKMNTSQTSKEVSDLNKFHDDLLKKYDKSLDLELDRLCGDDKMSSSQLAKSYPQVLRQLLLDSDKNNFELTKNYMCMKDLDSIVQKGVGNSCNGVFGSVNDRDGMKIKRMEYAYPFSSDLNYNIKKDKDSLVVKTKINFNFIPDKTAKLSESAQRAKFQKRLKKWRDDTNKYYASLKNKVKPKVRFEFDVGTGSESPVVNVSECFNLGLPEHLQHSCSAVKNTPEGDWQNAANYTLDMDPKVLYHEMGHLVGLDDEYDADYYPVNNLGETESIMNSGLKLFPRHIRRIIQPALRCEE